MADSHSSSPCLSPGVIRFERILNFRDVGELVNNFNPVNPDKTDTNKDRNGDGKARLRPGLLYRSARIDQATASDRDRLAHQLKIRTVVDLRSTTELTIAAKRHAAAAAAAAAADRHPHAEAEAEATPLKLPGIHYAEINLNGRTFERGLVWRLSYPSLAQFIWLMLTGYRHEAISILSREIIIPRGLTGLGIDTLEYSGAEIQQIFNEVLANADAYPVLVHCTHGKDRTGIVILILLLMLLRLSGTDTGHGSGTEMEAVVQDYRLSERELEPARDQMLQEMARFGLDKDEEGNVSLLGCAPDFCQEVVGHLDSKYGGVGKYLAGIGVDESQQAKVRSILLVAD